MPQRAAARNSLTCLSREVPTAYADLQRIQVTASVVHALVVRSALPRANGHLSHTDVHFVAVQAGLALPSDARVTDYSGVALVIVTHI